MLFVWSFITTTSIALLILFGDYATKPIKTKRHDKKSYDVMTPYARAMALPNLPLRTKLSLKEQYEKLNPVKLHDKIEVLQAKVSKLQQQLGYHYDVNLKPDR